MKCLISTRETQGQRANDFCWVPSGELVMVPITICSGETADASCGCARSMVGTTTKSATTTVLVANLPITQDQMAKALKDSLEDAGWHTDEDAAEGDRR